MKKLTISQAEKRLNRYCEKFGGNVEWYTNIYQADYVLYRTAALNIRINLVNGKITEEKP